MNILFRLRYYILSLFQVFFGLFNSLMLIKIFGVSAESDSIYLTTLIITSLGLIASSFSEQFLYFYTDLKVESKEKSDMFYGFVLFITFISQLIFTIFILLLINKVIFLFTGNIDPYRYNLVNKITLISLPQFFLIPFFQINNCVLNANNLIFKNMLTQFLASLILVFVYLYMYLFDNKNILLIPITNVFLSLSFFIMQIILIKKIGVKIIFKFKHELSKKFILNSLSMKIGHNIHNLLTQLIISNVLASLPKGVATSYSYGEKISNILKSILIAPYFSIMQKNIALFFPSKNIYKIKNEIKLFLLKVIPLHIISVIVILVLMYITKFNLIYFLPKITLKNIYDIGEIFFLISLWNLIIEIEIPYVQIIVSDKKSLVFIVVNSIFIITLYILYNSFLFSKNISGLIYSLIISQIINSILYITFSIFTLRKIDEG